MSPAPNAPVGVAASCWGLTSSLWAAAVARCSRFASSVARMFCRTMKKATIDTRTTAPAAATAVSTPIRVRSDRGVRSSLPSPPEIKKFLDEYVIGQDRTKRKLAVAVYQHYKRIELSRRRSDVEIQKSNIMLIGPTGTVGTPEPVKTTSRAPRPSLPVMV